MTRKVNRYSKLRGEISPPGDKSISHRALILNSVANGEAKITNLAPGGDVRKSTARCLVHLGAIISMDSSMPDTAIVHGRGIDGLREPARVLYAGNSGTTIRLLMGLLAAGSFLSIITGDSSLRARPMDRVVQPLRSMGAEIWGRDHDRLAPLAINGRRLRGIDYTLPIPSAQLKSAILIAGLFAEGKTTIRELAHSRDHTERLLCAMGVKIDSNDDSITVIPPDTSLTSIDMCIPGDISSAACWLVAGAIHPNAHITVRNVGVNPTRTGIIDVLMLMGAKLKITNQHMEGGEPIADITVESSDLRGTQISGELIPRLIDEIPLIAVAASAAQGKTTIYNAKELRVKESDRIATTAEELSKLGAKIQEMPDGMVIHGSRSLRGALCRSHNDHRLAMAIAIAGLITTGEQTRVHQDNAVCISYPTFWEDLDKLGGE